MNNRPMRLFIFLLLLTAMQSTQGQQNSFITQVKIHGAKPKGTNFSIKEAGHIETTDQNKDSIYAHYIKKIKDARKKKAYKEAILLTEKLFNFAQTQKDTLQLATARFREAFLYSLLPDLIKANKRYSEAIAYAAAANDKNLLIKLQVNKADIESKLGDFFQAQHTIRKALSYLRPGEDSLAHYQLFNTLGIACKNAGEFDNATKAYNQGLSYATSFEQRAILLNNIAVNYKEQQDYGAAIKIYNQLLAIDELDQYPETLARVKDNLGFALFNTGQNTSLGYLEEAYHIRKKLEDIPGLFASNIHLAEYYKNRDIRKALEHAQNAQNIALDMESPDWQLEALGHIIMLKEHPSKEAARYFFLKDSMERTTQTLRNEYISTKFFTEEKDKENLDLKQQNAQQALLAEKERTQKYALAGGMALSLAALGVFFLVFRKNQRQKREIEKQKAKVEHLQRELHHRLKNNLAFIDFFITLAKGRFPDPAYRQKLDELQNRINSMFEVHRQLYKKEDVTNVNARTYIATLMENIRKAFNSPNIRIEERVEDTELRADTSFPIGLIVNEFVTNSYKYAFPNGEKGTIFIHLKETPVAYHLHLADDGQGLPEDLDLENLNSFGMETIKLLTEEYNGTFHLDGHKGTRMDITFPKGKEKTK